MKIFFDKVIAEIIGLRPYTEPETLLAIGGLTSESVALDDILVDWLSSQVIF